MKKLLFMLLCFTSISAMAQTTMTASASNNTNATTTYHTYTQTANPAYFSLSVVVTKTSGTVAGTCLPQGSIDGTNYVNISTDTLTLADQTTNVKVWEFTNSYYKYYRVKVATTGNPGLCTAVCKIFQRLKTTN